MDEAKKTLQKHLNYLLGKTKVFNRTKPYEVLPLQEDEQKVIECLDSFVRIFSVQKNSTIHPGFLDVQRTKTQIISNQKKIMELYINSKIHKSIDMKHRKAKENIYQQITFKNLIQYARDNNEFESVAQKNKYTTYYQNKLWRCLLQHVVLMWDPYLHENKIYLPDNLHNTIFYYLVRNKCFKKQLSKERVLIMKKQGITYQGIHKLLQKLNRSVDEKNKSKLCKKNMCAMVAAVEVITKSKVAKSLGKCTNTIAEEISNVSTSSFISNEVESRQKLLNIFTKLNDYQETLREYVQFVNDFKIQGIETKDPVEILKKANKIENSAERCTKEITTLCGKKSFWSKLFS